MDLSLSHPRSPVSQEVTWPGSSGQQVHLILDNMRDSPPCGRRRGEEGQVTEMGLSGELARSLGKGTSERKRNVSCWAPGSCPPRLGPQLLRPLPV